MLIELHHQHPWDLSPEQAIQIQNDLRNKVVTQRLPEESLHLVGGVDACYGRERIFCAAVVVEYGTNALVEQVVVEYPLTFPYIPGLLSFREAPAILAAIEKLARLPDVLVVDGHGRAHPRRFGLACHLGVLLDVPAIGCAKSLFVGQVDSPGEAVGCTAEIVADEEVIGLALRIRQEVRPIYVSVGHKVDLPSAVRVVLSCSTGYRLPQPTRLADRLARGKQQERV